MGTLLGRICGLDHAGSGQCGSYWSSLQRVHLRVRRPEHRDLFVSGRYAVRWTATPRVLDAVHSVSPHGGVGLKDVQSVCRIWCWLLASSLGLAIDTQSSFLLGTTGVLTATSRWHCSSSSCTSFSLWWRRCTARRLSCQLHAVSPCLSLSGQTILFPVVQTVVLATLLQVCFQLFLTILQFCASRPRAVDERVAPTPRSQTPGVSGSPLSVHGKTRVRLVSSVPSPPHQHHRPRCGGRSDGCEVSGGTSSSASPWLW